MTDPTMAQAGPSAPTAPTLSEGLVVFGEDDWKGLCLRKMPSLQHDQHLWHLLTATADLSSPHRWRVMYQRICDVTVSRVRLFKSCLFICNVLAHHVAGPPLPSTGLQDTIVMERRLDIESLKKRDFSCAPTLYLEPSKDFDRDGFDSMSNYLMQRNRAALALTDTVEIIIIPPCDFLGAAVRYHGHALIALVQEQGNYSI